MRRQKQKIIIFLNNTTSHPQNCYYCTALWLRYYQEFERYCDLLMSIYWQHSITVATLENLLWRVLPWPRKVSWNNQELLQKAEICKKVSTNGVTNNENIDDSDNISLATLADWIKLSVSQQLIQTISAEIDNGLPTQKNSSYISIADILVNPNPQQQGSETNWWQ